MSVLFQQSSMAPSENETHPSVAGDGWFHTTHWSVVLRAGHSQTTEAGEALAKLCKIYWYPLYVFARRQGQNSEDARDLIQGFFERVIEKHYLQAAEQEKGRFRSFLLILLKRFMANEQDRANRLKRGGGCAVISLDQTDTEARYLKVPADEMSPEKAYDRSWALTLLEQVNKRLEQEFATAGKAGIFRELSVFLTGEAAEHTYAELGQKLGLSEANVKVSVHRLRQRYRELLRLEIANTVSSPEAIDDEIRDLFAVLS
jgi:RNA polymerase sigma-70 factor (ECF subfamily)